MGWIVTLLMVVQVICAGAIIILVLLQHGKGADMGAAFGGGASGSLFGASGSANFLSRTTAVIAGIFFLTTIGLAYSATQFRVSHGGGLMSTTVPASGAPAGGAAPAPGTAPATGGTATGGTAAPADSGKAADIPK
jgi:preprotein translocase subunit SecG